MRQLDLTSLLLIPIGQRQQTNGTVTSLQLFRVRSIMIMPGITSVISQFIRSHKSSGSHMFSLLMDSTELPSSAIVMNGVNVIICLSNWRYLLWVVGKEKQEAFAISIS